MTRESFRQVCARQEDHQCIVPWCPDEVTEDPNGPGEIHHIIERELWADGGYIPENGAPVCNFHHRMAERNEIPPQAFWRWRGVDPTIPDEYDSIHIDKWGDRFETPTGEDLREFQKYPSTRHLFPVYWHEEKRTADSRKEDDDTGHTSVDSLLRVPLVATTKLDGSNCMLVRDKDTPIRSRSGGEPRFGHTFSVLKNEYWKRNVYEKLQDLDGRLQVFGENMQARHSIHYGCPHDGCDCSGEHADPGPDCLEDVFYVFGVYDERYHLWLSWPEVERVADELGFPTPPMWANALPHPNKKDRGLSKEDIGRPNASFPEDSKKGEDVFLEFFTRLGENMIQKNHEGYVVRSLYPMHSAQFPQKVGKYVRPNHVKTEEHWGHKQMIMNNF